MSRHYTISIIIFFFLKKNYLKTLSNQSHLFLIFLFKYSDIDFKIIIGGLEREVPLTSWQGDSYQGYGPGHPNVQYGCF
jgi:hypothetical protein